MLDAKIAHRLFSPITVFESASTLALIMHVEKVISTAAAPTPEHFAMRAGVAEGIELLDNVLNPPEGTFARKAMDVLRALMRKMDASKQ